MRQTSWYHIFARGAGKNTKWGRSVKRDADSTGLGCIMDYFLGTFHFDSFRPSSSLLLLMPYQFRLGDFLISLEAAQVLYESELKQKLGHAPRYYLTFWTSLSGRQAPERVIRVDLRRQGVDQLIPVGYQELFVQSKCEFLPWKPLVFKNVSRGVATAHCLEFSLLRETRSHDDRVAFDTIGSGSVAMLNILNLAIAHKIFRIEADIKLRAAEDVAGGKMWLKIDEVSYEDVTEVYDTAMEPDFQSAVNQVFCALGWMHMLKTDPSNPGVVINPNALDPLLPIADRSIVPQCNTPSGVTPVDFFFDFHNPPGLPGTSEAEWLRIAENALWTRGLTLADADKLLDENLDQPKHYRPRFELVISSLAKMFTGAANAMPYRSDTYRAVSSEQPSQSVEVGTDYFRSAFTQLSGDCDDVAKATKEMAVQFGAAKFTNPTLQKLQRLADSFDAQAQLLIVTSAKLETDDKSAATKFVPVPDRQYGLHAAVILRPRTEVIKMLARTVGQEEAEKLFTGARPAPPVASSVGSCQLEGTGNMNSRLMPMRTYVMKAAEFHPADAAIAQEMADREDRRIQMTMKIFRDNQELLTSFGFKPEMGPMDPAYKYDFNGIWTGNMRSASTFYAAEVEAFTTTPLAAGQRNCRFVLVDRGADGKDFKKSALFDSIIAGDDRVAMFPQAPVTDAVSQTAAILCRRQEPSPVVDGHPHFSGPDVLLSTMAKVFGTVEIPAPSASHVPVDLYVYNWRLDGADRAKDVPKLKQKLLAIDGVDALYYRSMEHVAGLVNGVVRLWVGGGSAAATK